MKGTIIIEPEHSDITDILGYQGLLQWLKVGQLMNS